MDGTGGHEVERRGAVRVSLRGYAVLHADDGPGPLHGSLENLSTTGALVHVASRPPETDVELELRLADGNGWIAARTVRVERVAPRQGWRIALAFGAMDASTRAAIAAAIEHARSVARTRPVLVIDDRGERRATLIAQLAGCGMTPLAPRTALEAIDLLTRAQLHVSVCLLAPGFGVASSSDLAAILSDSFPWLTTAEITDDLDGTVARALAAWQTSPVARRA